VIDFACGEEHLIFVSTHNQAFGIGKNQFGELGNKFTGLNRETI
jgi:alpha-tubulin suppressor-like RCC1 family protein